MMRGLRKSERLFLARFSAQCFYVFFSIAVQIFKKTRMCVVSQTLLYQLYCSATHGRIISSSLEQGNGGAPARGGQHSASGPVRKNLCLLRKRKKGWGEGGERMGQTLGDGERNQKAR